MQANLLFSLSQALKGFQLKRNPFKYHNPHSIMVRKRELSVLCFVILAILSMNFILAANNSATTTTASANLGAFDNGFSCLKDQLNSKSASSMTMEELTFSLLAMGYDSGIQSKLKTELDLRKDSANCWPKSSCTLKDTALVFLAYEHIGANTNSIKNWMLNQTIAPSDLIWYLQIDPADQSSCKITYDNSAKTITISADKKITGSAGACFSIAQGGYWLEIKNNCYGKEFKISCDKDFLTSLIYKSKSNTNPAYYISALTHSQGPSGETSEKVESVCFKQAGACNYEGSLWASLALSSDSDLRDKVLPYLMALSSLNDRIFPSAFLYSLTNYDEYLNEISDKQNSKGYWQITDTTKRYYDTALAMLSLYGKSSEQAQKAAEYLLDPNVQGSDGCWGGDNIRDTAFILYSASPKQASSSGSTSKCSDNSEYSCTSAPTCTEELSGTILDNFYCGSLLKCCSKRASESSCSSKGGIKCMYGEECVGGTMESASSTSLCCVDGECKTKEDQYTCESSGADYTCRTACSANENEDSSLTCPENGVCCSATTQQTGSSLWWIWLLLILIVLLVLAIIYRNQLKIWVFKMKNKFSKSPSSPSQPRPPFPPYSQMRPMGMMPRRMLPPGAMMPPRPMLRPGQRPPAPAPQGKPYPRDKELAETLEKLKRIGK